MKNIKKAVILVLCALLCISLFGCGEKGDVVSIPSADESFKGQTVNIATSVDPYLSRSLWEFDYVKEKLGVDIEQKIYSPHNIHNEITADAAADNAPDIFYVNRNFHAALPVLQPLTNGGISLDDFEQQAIIKAVTVDGEAYLAAGFDPTQFCYDVCVYNKEIFEQNRLTTPKEFYEKGEWTVENFISTAKKIASLSNKHVGARLLGESIIPLSRDAFFSLENERIVYGDAPRLTENMSLFSSLKRDGVLKLDSNGFRDGYTGMALTSTFGITKTGYFSSINPQHLGVTFMPKPSAQDKHVVSSPIRGYGIVKASKNARAAGAVIKLLTDSEMFIKATGKNSDWDNTFHNEEVRQFYYDMYEEYKNDIVYYLTDEVYLGQNLNAESSLGIAHQMWNRYDGAELISAAYEYRQSFNKMCDDANKTMNKRDAD